MIRIAFANSEASPLTLQTDEFVQQIEDLASSGLAQAPLRSVMVERLDEDGRVIWVRHYSTFSRLRRLARDLGSPTGGRRQRPPLGEGAARPASTRRHNKMDAQVLETDAKAAWDAGDYDRTATLLLQGYGNELLSFLIARLGNHGDGQEAFSMFAEDMWVGLPKFGWRSSLRTWSYTIARNAANRFARSPNRRAERNLTLSQNASISQLVEQVRTQTNAYKVTTIKNRVRVLRDQLDPDDRMLLVLRIDRAMAWRDLAQVMMGQVEGEGDVDADAVDREAARLRKRFERVKADLKKLAKADGLV